MAAVTVIFRRALVGSPRSAQFAAGTFWTTEEGSAELLAQIEARTPDLPPSGGLYCAEVPIVRGENLAPDEVIKTLLQSLRLTPDEDRLRQIRDALRTVGERRAKENLPWVQFVNRGPGLWEGAMLYTGDEPIPAELRPEPGA